MKVDIILPLYLPTPFGCGGRGGVGFNRETESFIQEMSFPHPHTPRWFGKPRKHAFIFLRNVKLGGILQHYWLLLARFLYVCICFRILMGFS